MVAPRRRATGKSLITLYEKLIRLAPQWHFRFYYQPRPDQDLPWNNLPPNVAFVPLSMRGDRWDLWEQIRLPWQAHRDRVDLLHCPAQTAPLWKPVPTVVTIHDLIPIRFDEGWPARRVHRLRRNMARSLRDAAAIITVSDHSRRDLLEMFPEAVEQRIERIYWAPDESSQVLSDQGAISEVCARYGVQTKRYLFALGGDTPRKNTEGLLRAFATATNNERFGLDLLVGGLPSSTLERCRTLIAGCRSRERINLFGYFPNEHLAPLFNGAKAFVFPSYYEGFGLPILDAMACGCPVLASAKTSIPEVAHDAALYFEPDSIDDMVVAMTRIATDSALETQLHQAGLSRAAEFSWAQTAEQVYDLFNRILCRRSLEREITKR